MSEAEAGTEASGEAADERLREDLAALRLDRDALPERARRRRWPWVLAVLVAIGIAAAALAPRAARVEVARAEAFTAVQGASVPVLTGSGYLVPADPFVAVGSRIAGRIERYLVDEGDRVARGDALVELEARPYRAVVDQLEASLASARARHDLARREQARARELRAGDVLAEGELDRRESEARVADAQVRELEAGLARARIDLEDAVIRAPTDGVVLETYKQPGEVAVPGGFSGSGDLLRMANLAEIRAELDVNEADLERVFLGQDAEVVPDALPDARYAARVVELAPQIDRQKGTRDVEVRLLEPDERLLPDMSVRVTFFAELGAGRGARAEAGSAVVPRPALRRDEGGRSFVWVVSDGRARKTPVDVADTLGERVVLASGLAGGETVVVVGEPRGDGAPVEIR